MVQSLFQGLSYTTIAQIIAMASQFGVSILLTRTLGPEQFGLYGVFLNFATALSTFCDFGVNSAITKYVADSEAQDKTAAAQNILTSALILHAFFFIILGIVAYFFADVVTQIWFDDDKILYYTCLAVIPLLVFVGDLTGALYGYRQLIFAGNRIVLQALLLLAVNLFVIVVASLNTQVAAINYALTYAVLLGVLAWQFRNRLTRQRFEVIWAAIRKILSFSWPLGLIFPIQSLIAYAPVLLTKAVGSLNETQNSVLGLLTLAILLGNIVHSLLMSIIRSMYGYAATWRAQSDTVKLRRYLWQMHIAIGGVYVMLLVACIWLLPPFIAFVYGATYTKATTYTLLVIVANLTRTLTILNNSFLNTFEKTLSSLFAHIMELILYTIFITSILMLSQTTPNWPIVLLIISIITGMLKVAMLLNISWRTVMMAGSNEMMAI